MGLIRRYSELKNILSFNDRYDYLRLGGIVGKETFGHNRYLNQSFYNSKIWRQTRDKVIIRDNGCDLGVEGYEIKNKIYIHHMNAITIDDIVTGEDWILDPEFLICVSYDTHQAIHYGDASLLPQVPIERFPGDTCPWKR